jgi:hypothetical protein
MNNNKNNNNPPKTPPQFSFSLWLGAGNVFFLNAILKHVHNPST